MYSNVCNVGSKRTKSFESGDGDCVLLTETWIDGVMVHRANMLVDRMDIVVEEKVQLLHTTNQNQGTIFSSN